jgi:RNA polymerase sigma-70 factor (ECF subfamily)
VGGPMLVAPDDDTELLLRRAGAGDRLARDRLLDRHRDRLRQVIAYRLDRRLAARVDPSDVVQEALADAARRLPAYLRERPLPFYPWLRQLALERLIELHRRHIHAQKRSITREAGQPLPLNDESATALAERLLAAGGNPVGELLRDELRGRVQAILDRLPERDREVLVLRHLDQLSVREMAAVLGIREGAVKTRHLRALQRFRELLGREGESV